MTTDLLVQQNADHFTAALRTSHHSMCWHDSQVARLKVSDRNWRLLWTDQLVVIRVHTASPAWSIVLNRIISIRTEPLVTEMLASVPHLCCFR